MGSGALARLSRALPAPSAARPRTLASLHSSSKCSCRPCSGWTAPPWRLGPCRPSSGCLLPSARRGAGSAMVRRGSQALPLLRGACSRGAQRHQGRGPVVSGPGPRGGPSGRGVCGGTEGVTPGALAGVHPVTLSPAVRSGFLHLAEALTFRGDPEAVSSTVRAIVATLKSGEQCDVEPELISKGTRAAGSTEDPLAAPESLCRVPPAEQNPGGGAVRPGVGHALGPCDGHPF